jgi:uncharacterized protein (DUF1697 family)
VRGRSGERIALGRREIYVAYGERIRDSKLVIPPELLRTVRNLNTVEALARLAGAGD